MISVIIPKNSDRMPKHSNYKVQENPGEGGGGGGWRGGRERRSMTSSIQSFLELLLVNK